MPDTVIYQGCKFSYTVSGTGAPIVFIQGVGLHGEGWRPQTEALCRRFRCLTFDNRGMASSQPPAMQISVPQMAADTVAIMNAAGMSFAHIVGHSLGGCVAQQIGLSYPDRVKSLSLFCTSARGSDATRLTWKMAWLGARSRIGTRQMRRLAFLKFVMSAEYLRTHDPCKVVEQLAPIFGHDLGTTPPIVTQQLNALKGFDVSTQLDQLTAIPTLVVSASDDVIFAPCFGRALANRIPGAKFIELQNAAHGVTIERADEVNAAIIEHIEASDDIT